MPSIPGLFFPCRVPSNPAVCQSRAAEQDSWDAAQTLPLNSNYYRGTWPCWFHGACSTLNFQEGSYIRSSPPPSLCAASLHGHLRSGPPSSTGGMQLISAGPGPGGWQGGGLQKKVYNQLPGWGWTSATPVTAPELLTTAPLKNSPALLSKQCWVGGRGRPLPWGGAWMDLQPGPIFSRTWGTAGKTCLGWEVVSQQEI